MNKKILFWSLYEEAEDLHYNTEEAALKELVTMHEHCKIPAEVTLYGFARLDVFLGSYSPLQELLDYLDAEYGHPDDEPNGATFATRAAEKIFIEAVLKEYVPWACKCVIKKKVNPFDYIKRGKRIVFK